jgi:hypothetical protein
MSIKTNSRSISAPDTDSQPADDEAGASQANVNRIESHTLIQTDSDDVRQTLIAEAAYHRAQQRGFAAGQDWQDWFNAEREVDILLDREL